MPPGGPPVSVFGCILSKGTQIYIVKGLEFEWFLRYMTLNEVGWAGRGGMPLWGSPVSVTGSVLS